MAFCVNSWFITRLQATIFKHADFLTKQEACQVEDKPEKQEIFVQF